MNQRIEAIVHTAPSFITDGAERLLAVPERSIAALKITAQQKRRV